MREERKCMTTSSQYRIIFQKVACGLLGSQRLTRQKGKPLYIFNIFYLHTKILYTHFFHEIFYAILKYRKCLNAIQSSKLKYYRNGKTLGIEG